MKKTNVKVWVGVIALIFASSLVAQAQTWSYTGDLNTRRDYHTYSLTGMSSWREVCIGHGINSAEVYKPSPGKFTVTGALNNGRYKHAATLLTNGEVLIVGGQYNAVCLSSAEFYKDARHISDQA